jgi:predicted deacylase
MSDDRFWRELAPGRKATLSHLVAARADGSRVELPVMCACGAAPGKTLLITAGVHGDEFEGPAAIWRLFQSLDPVDLAGNVIAVPLANPPAYEAGLRTNPDDRQDLARVFPGDPQGTVTEQIAHALTQRFIRHADLYCDLHSAGQYYQMPPLAGYQLRPEPLLSQQRAAAKAFGLPLVWGTPGLPGRSLSAAGEHGVPAIYVEITGEGRCRAADVERYVHGLRQLLAHLAIAGERLEVYDPQWFVEDQRPGAGHLQVQHRAPIGGFFEPSRGVGDRVEEGQPVGVIRDRFGQTRHTLQASRSGMIVFLRTFPRVLCGDALCMILELDA